MARAGPCFAPQGKVLTKKKKTLLEEAVGGKVGGCFNRKFRGEGSPWQKTEQ